MKSLALIMPEKNENKKQFNVWAATMMLKYVAVVLAIICYTLVVYRAGGVKAEQRYESWQERFVEDYISQQEAKALGYPADPKVELHKQEVTEFAKLMSGLKLYGYGADDYRTLAQCLYCRKANPDYPDTIVEVIEQANQWPGYSSENEVTEKGYQLAERIINELDSASHLAISSDFVYASFENDGIILRDTWEFGVRTHTWSYEE